jgi:hypothetical protein
MGSPIDFIEVRTINERVSDAEAHRQARPWSGQNALSRDADGRNRWILSGRSRVLA